tara:strand:- start:128 stop:1162 length:1035 start_codon:yes stop_codon:yes gene_type:complete
MRLLFLQLKHIGDALLLTPTLSAVRAAHPDAEIHVVVRRGSEGILAGCPAIDHLQTAAAPAGNRGNGSWWRDARLALRLRRARFDRVFELSEGDRGRWLAWLSGAKRLYTNDCTPPLGNWWRRQFTDLGPSQWKGVHQVEKNFRTMSRWLDLPEDIPPLNFAKDAAEPWPEHEPFILFHPATRWVRKRWPRERWIKLGQKLANGRKIIISCGPNENEVSEAKAIAEGIGPVAKCTGGQLSWSQLAGAMHAAELFVGVDTAAMHLASACQCPTVAIFGPTQPWAWRPWNVEHRLVGPTEEDWNEVRNQGGRDPEVRQLILRVQVPVVLEACKDLLDTQVGTRPST